MVRSVYIDGIGIISRCAKSAEDLAEIVGGNKINFESGKIGFECSISPSKLRRCSRYSKLAAAAADDTRIDADIPEDMDKYRIGTIFSTGYGALENNIEFSDPVVSGDPQKFGMIYDTVSRSFSVPPDVVFTSENGTYFDNLERRALEMVFGSDKELNEEDLDTFAGGKGSSTGDVQCNNGVGNISVNL